MVKALSAGELVLLIDSRGREFLTRLETGHRFHSHHGFIEHDAIIGKDEGCMVHASRGSPLLIFRPTLSQIIMNMPRQAQVIYPKDIGAILMWGDVFPGATVVEVGTGYGALTMALLRAVGPQGRLTSYEIREDFYRAAQRTVLNYLGDCPQWTIRLADAVEGFQEKEVDRVLIDVSEPWKFLPVIKETLRPGGILLCFMANAIQVKSLHDGFHELGGFARWETIETLVRPWHVKGLSVRPGHPMTAHTGFITAVRRIGETRGFDPGAERENGQVTPAD
jgi:tRNA (adenine57-N1/adenine58-N1)-methyltransferase catalytic subunit